MAVLVPKFTLPGDAHQWMLSSEVDECEVSMSDRWEGGPLSAVLAPKSDPARAKVRVWVDKMADGAHLYTSAHPGESESKVFHLALRRKAERDMKVSTTAAIASALALRHHEKEHRVHPGDHSTWMRRAHVQILRALQKHGGEAMVGMGPVFLEMNRAAIKLVDKALGKDVEDSWLRVRREFAFLGDHASEEDVLRAWREAIVDKVSEH